jgi:hypothetical protein
MKPDTITDAYLYLLGRALVIRQEQIDMADPNIGYNDIQYNELGSAEFVNPNFDVAYLEAWIAPDEDQPVHLEIPRRPDASRRCSERELVAIDSG